MTKRYGPFCSKQRIIQHTAKWTNQSGPIYFDKVEIFRAVEEKTEILFV